MIVVTAMAPSIIATCKQTRFHLLDEKPAREIDVENLTISVVAPLDDAEDPAKAKTKGKSKAKAEARELISDAHLRLKAGTHYGLVGRNGTGKSTLLRAMADKLVPGIPHLTRMAILQQTDAEAQEGLQAFGDESQKHRHDESKPILEYAISSDHHRNEVIGKMNCKILARFPMIILIQPPSLVEQFRDGESSTAREGDTKNPA